jgi:CubicO group peptidase (beta-lactamase class C family)
LLHNSGIGRELDSLNSNWNKTDLKNTLIELIPAYKIGEKVKFSELNLLLLQFIVEEISGEPLNQLIKKKLFDPIGMKNTSFGYKESNSDLLFESNNSRYIGYKSELDILNHIMNGVTGFGNLYSSVNDLSIFAQLMLQRGYYSGMQYISAETVDNFTGSQLPESYAGLGWQTTISEINIFDKLPLNAFGINSSSGSSLWIDPHNKIFIIFLAESEKVMVESIIPRLQKEVYEVLIK